MALDASPAQQLISLPPEDRDRLLQMLTRDQAQAILNEWRFWARPDQIAPEGDWRIWFLRSGRGAGKTRAGAEWCIEGAKSGEVGRTNLVARTAAAARDEMVEGPSGILTVSKPDFRPIYEPSKRKVTWPNGAVALLYSADEPDRLRGPQCHRLWADEVGAWRYQQQTWDMAMLGLRLGDNPQAVVTSTPSSSPVIKNLVSREGKDVVITRASTYDNRAHLAPGFFEDIVSRYEGTRLGRQEIYAELLDDAPGALWKRDWIEDNRVHVVPDDMFIVVVGVDPSGSSDEGAAECGIVAAGATRNGHIYVLDDRSLRATSKGWATEAIACLNTHRADCIVAERNYGGDMVKHTISTIDSNVSVREANATRGKEIRAEPIASKYEQERVHHVGQFPILEDQMCSWEPKSSARSPDRLDALVWAITELLKRLRGSGASVTSGGRQRRVASPRSIRSNRDRVAGYQ